MAVVRRCLGLFLLALLLVPSPAAAHSDSVETNPTDGARLRTLPAEATMTFNEAPKQADVVLARPDGKVDKLAAQVIGSRVTARLPANGARGPYTLSYRVVSADGHPVSGSVSFTITTGPVPTTPRPTPSPTPSTSSTPDTAGDRSDLVPVALGLAVVGILGAVLVARSVRR